MKHFDSPHIECIRAFELLLRLFQALQSAKPLSDVSNYTEEGVGETLTNVPMFVGLAYL
jgi:hypothetical protein